MKRILLFALGILLSSFVFKTDVGEVIGKTNYLEIPTLASIDINIDEPKRLSGDEVLQIIEEEKKKTYYLNYPACSTGSFKSYTDYNVYKNSSTKQYQLQVSKNTYTNNDGFRILSSSSGYILFSNFTRLRG